MKKSHVALSALSAVLFGSSAQAAFFTDWRAHTTVQYRYFYNILPKAIEGPSPDSAAELAASRCGPEVERLEQEGYRVTMFRGSSIPTGYGWLGNCDVQVLDLAPVPQRSGN